MQSLAKPPVVGPIALALTLAATAHFVVKIGWRAYGVLAWRRRGTERRRPKGA